MSHELRTPVNAIIGFTRLVRRKSADLLPLRQQENLKRVEISANQLLTLINDILDLSKIEAGKMNVNIMPLNLAPLVDTCFATVESMVKAGRVRLIKEVPHDLPEVASDQDKLKQIIINLLSNALKFTEEGEVRLSATLENASLRIAVSDTGIGIPSDALEYIFDEFRQIDGSSTREHGGTGLGLSITKKLTHLLGGIIDVSSVVEKGSIFTVTLPFAKMDQEPVVLDRGNGLNPETRRFAAYAVEHGYQVELREPESPWWQELRVLLKYKKFLDPSVLDQWSQRLADKSRTGHRVPAATVRRWMDHWQSDLTVDQILAHGGDAP